MQCTEGDEQANQGKGPGNFEFYPGHRAGFHRIRLHQSDHFYRLCYEDWCRRGRSAWRGVRYQVQQNITRSMDHPSIILEVSGALIEKSGQDEVGEGQLSV